jgi:hypothetical protein
MYAGSSSHRVIVPQRQCAGALLVGLVSSEPKPCWERLEDGFSMTHCRGGFMCYICQGISLNDFGAWSPIARDLRRRILG